MSLNCKLGDLAVIVRSPRIGGRVQQWTLGRVVRCVEFIRARNGAAGWVMEQRLTSPCGRFTGDSITDACLRPLRPVGGEDEILRLAGKPQDLKQPTPTEAPKVAA